MDKLFANIDFIHTTKLGENRIRKNLDVEYQDVVSYCKKIIMNPSVCIIKKHLDVGEYGLAIILHR